MVLPYQSFWRSYYRLNADKFDQIWERNRHGTWEPVATHVLPPPDMRGFILKAAEYIDAKYI